MVATRYDGPTEAAHRKQQKNQYTPGSTHNSTLAADRAKGKQAALRMVEVRSQDLAAIANCRGGREHAQWRRAHG
jgi:hypothetical protein